MLLFYAIAKRKQHQFEAIAHGGWKSAQIAFGFRMAAAGNIR